MSFLNILICSAGRRVKLIEYFKEELHKENGIVIAVDCNPTAPALFAADHFEIVPRIDENDYVEQIKAICLKHNVQAILTLIDPELTLLAERKEEFEREGIQVIVSKKEVVDICFDKYKTYQYVSEAGLDAVPTYLEFEHVLEDIHKGKIQLPLMVKPRMGSASLGIRVIHTIEELDAFSDCHQEVVIQPFITGEEYGIDCFVDLLSKETIDIFMKKKIKMRAGETDKSISIRDLQLRSLIERLLGVLELIGPIDIDCFYTENGYVISEINPRFGGGYLHAYEMGRNFVQYIINNIRGVPNLVAWDDYEEGVTLVKYDRVMLIPKETTRQLKFEKAEMR